LDRSRLKANDAQENYGLHRIDIHQVLLKTCLQESGSGTPCLLLTKHRAQQVSSADGRVVFENGVEITADLIVRADGIGSKMRAGIGIIPDITPSDTYYRCVMDVQQLRDLGLDHVRIIGERKIPQAYCLITHETLPQLQFPSQRSNANTRSFRFLSAMLSISGAG
jgi:2-polyprenyl-6-methoxyphenol hydroxylase-like FAD-dependent oxidoreductase